MDDVHMYPFAYEAVTNQDRAPFQALKHHGLVRKEQHTRLFAYIATGQ